MRNLQDLLNKFSKSLNRDALLKEKVVEVIKGKTNIILSNETVHIKDDILEISASPVVKNEIKLKEEEVLNELRKETSLNFSRIFYK